MHEEDIARIQFLEGLQKQVDCDVKLKAMTGREIADLLLVPWGEADIDSAISVLLSQVMERLKLANGGPITE